MRKRLLALALGLLLGLIPVWIFWPFGREAEQVKFLHAGVDQVALLKEREQALASAPAGAAKIRPGHLPRFWINRGLSSQIFPIDGDVQDFDPQTYFRHASNVDLVRTWPEHPRGKWRMRTNSLGLREDGEPLAHKPDLRVLVAGDSHTEGVCDNFESLAHVLGRVLGAWHPGKTVESINAAKGGFSFYSYLGTLEKFLYLQPDVFVVVVYGGNDFEEVLNPYHFFSGTPRPPGASTYWPLVKKTLAISPVWLAQDGNSLKYFQEQPSEIKVALHAAQESALDIQQLCREHGIQLVYAYLPGFFDSEDPAFVVDPQRPWLRQRLYATIELRPGAERLHEHMGNALIAFLAEQHIPVLDLRQVFKRSKGPFFWKADQHINVNAHKLIGTELARLIDETWRGGER